jgi:hypothetical protein
MHVWLMASGYIHCLEVGVETIRHRDGMARHQAEVGACSPSTFFPHFSCLAICMVALC